jgi:hypothetical protein
MHTQVANAHSIYTNFENQSDPKYMFIGFLYEFWRDSGSIFPQYELFVMCVSTRISVYFLFV